ncbi:patatin-like phospholipase family protein [Sinomicrobium weinanense]|uniref:Patatin-like phospholipase family protein n=1 Tax=Sinomicrobium weinanense TaxID=2842200 RepID=A0A926JNH1_9FLAO|nr:patatin-like phospholipase family protein [Sinomicrobium weinanense]MBC9794414.1 patatin-like phospholipase family protein [Sinomicrobium weinanense]MBU3124321.1 patatin-like phospholipase family protein [Sinomicrobium weinanense]
MKKHVLLFLLCMTAIWGNAQENSPEDVKVGLVLSGGGAKGLAHIGALKVIEEAGVRIDYVGGTSMGAIIGALYASGYTANQLDSIFRVVDFSELIQDNVPRSARTFYEKKNSERYALTLPFDRFKISFPRALSKGQNIYNLLVKLLYHVNDVNDFNQLPTPFFCIATNVETGEPVMLDKGYLPEAILASGSFPSLFNPVEIGGEVLIDGGVVNNYPIDELKALGAQVVVGVDVQDALADRDELNSAADILLQISNYRTVNDMKKKSRQTDIYIKPDIKDFSVVSFDKGTQIITNGEKAAKKHVEELRELASRQSAAPPPVHIPPQDSVDIRGLTLEGNDKYSRAYIKGKLRFTTSGKVSFTKLDQGMANLSATNNFESIRYRFVENKEGEGNDMFMKLQENKRTMLLRFGLHYDALYKSAALINITKKQFLFDDDVLSLDLILGDNLRYNLDYFLDKGFYWSFGLRSSYNRFTTDVDVGFLEETGQPPVDGLNSIGAKVSDLTNQAYLQTVFKEEFSVGAGLEHKRLKIESETISQGDNRRAVFENSDFYSAYGFMKLDTYDNRYFPRKGLYFDGDFHFYYASSDYNNNFSEFSIAKAKMGFAAPLFRKVAFNLTTEGGFKMGNSDVETLGFLLGGYGNDLINNFTPFLGYDFVSFGGDSYVKATATVDYEFMRKNHLNFTANVANAGNGIFKDGEWVTAPTYTGYAVGYGLETFIGPIELKYSWSPERGKGLWFFNLGFWF